MQRTVDDVIVYGDASTEDLTAFKRVDVHSNGARHKPSAAGNHNELFSVSPTTESQQLLDGSSSSPARVGRRPAIAEKKQEIPDTERFTELQRHVRNADRLFLDNCRKLFQKYDADGSGSIDKSELALVLESMGYALTPEQVQELLSQVDVDGGGSLDIDEFTVLIQLWKEAAQYKIFESDASVSKQHIDKSAEQKIRAMLDDGRWRWAWQIVLILVAVYFWMSVWVLWNWNDEPNVRADVERDLLGPDIACTIVLLMEMMLRFRIGFLSDDDKLVDDKAAIAMRYFRTWFFYDLITMLPLRFFTIDHTTSFWLRHVRLLLVLRIPFLFNKSKMVNITSTYVQFHFAFLPFFEVFIAFICIILTLAMVHQELVRQSIALGLKPPAEARFAASVYWTMYIVSGVGYGDMVPQTDNDRWFTSFLFLFSMISNGFFVGTMVSLMQEADVESSRQTRLVQTQAVLNFFEVPTGLQNEIIQFQNHTLVRDIAISYSDFVDALPEDMRESILMQCRVPLLQQVSIFKGTHISTLVQVATRLQQSTSVPEQYVAIYGEENFGMFVVNYGFVDCIGPNGHYITTLKREDAFGEPGLLREDVRFEISFKSLTYCDLFALAREDLKEVAKRFPRFEADLKAKRLLVKCRYTEMLREQAAAQLRRIGSESEQMSHGSATVHAHSSQSPTSSGLRSVDAKMMVTLTGASANNALRSIRDARRKSSLVVVDDGLETLDAGTIDGTKSGTASDAGASATSAEGQVRALEEQASEVTKHIEALESEIAALLQSFDGAAGASQS